MDEKFTLILKMLEDFRSEMLRRFDDVDKRFEQIDKRFEQVDKRFEQMDKRLDRIENNQVREKDRLDAVYESRNKVKVTFGWQWGMISLFIAIVAVGLIKVLEL